MGGERKRLLANGFEGEGRAEGSEGALFRDCLQIVRVVDIQNLSRG
jgi:hypothetical protein